MLSGTWLGVAPRTDENERDTCLKEIGPRVQNVTLSLGLLH